MSCLQYDLAFFVIILNLYKHKVISGQKCRINKFIKYLYNKKLKKCHFCYVIDIIYIFNVKFDIHEYNF